MQRAQKNTNGHKTIGQTIRVSRQARGMATLADLGVRLALRGITVSDATLSRIETGIQPVPLDYVTELAAILGVSPRTLRPDVAAKFSSRKGRTTHERRG